MCGRLEGATLPREGGRRHRNRAALACKRLRSRYNVGASAAVNPRCRIITFEGANEQANWRIEGAFPCSRYAVRETKMIRQTRMKFALIALRLLPEPLSQLPRWRKPSSKTPAIVRNSTPTR